MENIETLLAAVAQIDDDEPASSQLGVEKSAIGGDDPPSAAAVIGAGEKRKRGRPPRGKMTVKFPPLKRSKPAAAAEEEEEEDVCFICFDGGSLVLCDRKCCPKAYHPACIKRDEAFFKSKAKWNCGWHICSVCRKASHYMCYTCTYSLCKGCKKDADYVCVRGKMGFCSTCLKTIMLIENKDQANTDSVQVDFDDQGSWEYLFKVYWVLLKDKLSLTLSELTKAKKPWKGVATVSYQPLSSNVIPTGVTVEVPVSYNSTEHLELNKPVEMSQNDGLKITVPSISNNVVKQNNESEEDKPRHNKDGDKPSMDEVMQEMSIDKATDDLSTVRNIDESCICKNSNDRGLEKLGINHSTEWATKDLLEFVAHMKNGDKSALTKFDVQSLLLDYINRNSLWDLHRKSHIICDPMLLTLFGKPRVGHIEMLKLLELHLLIKEDSQKNSFTPDGIDGIVSSVKSDVEVDKSEEDIRSDDKGRKDECVGPNSGFPQNGRRSISPNKEDNEEKSIEERNRMVEKTDASGSSSSGEHTTQINVTNEGTVDSNDQSSQRSILESTTVTCPVGNSPSSDIIEIEKLWHYRDSNDKIRGPFSMMQLREWSTTGLYSPDTRIWTNHEQYDSLLLADALNGKFHGASDLSNSVSQKDGADEETGLVNNVTKVSDGESKKTADAKCSNNNVNVLSGSWPQCWDLLKENNASTNYGNLLSDAALPDQAQENDQFRHVLQNGENKSMTIRRELYNQSGNEDWARVGPPSEVNLRSLNIDPIANDVELSLSPDSNKHGKNISMLDIPSRTQSQTAENRRPDSSDVPVQNSGILELLSLTPKSNNEDQKIETKNSGFVIFPEIGDEWFKYSSSKPPEVTSDSHQLTHPVSNMPNWLANINEPIEFFDALGEESVSDLLAEVDAMESQGALHSPTSSMKFAQELLEDCKDDCFSSIEEFSRKSDDLSSTGEIQLDSQSSVPCKPVEPSPVNAIHSSASSEGETNAPTAVGPSVGLDGVDPGWGTIQGNINVVTVQGNVNLVLGGPNQGMTGLNWVNPNLNLSPMNGQRKYGGERFSSPREWGYQGPRPPWGWQPAYGGGGYSRPLPKGQRVCKFYESGRCKKGAFCDYLHP